MVEPSQDPTIRELVEKVAALEAENARLGSYIEDIFKGSNRLAQQVGALLNQIGLMDLQMMELTEKVFPGYIRTQRQIMEICNPPTNAEEGKDEPG